MSGPQKNRRSVRRSLLCHDACKQRDRTAAGICVCLPPPCPRGCTFWHNAHRPAGSHVATATLCRLCSSDGSRHVAHAPVQERPCELPGLPTGCTAVACTVGSAADPALQASFWQRGSNRECAQGPLLFHLRACTWHWVEQVVQGILKAPAYGSPHWLNLRAGQAQQLKRSTASQAGPPCHRGKRRSNSAAELFKRAAELPLLLCP